MKSLALLFAMLAVPCFAADPFGFEDEDNKPSVAVDVEDKPESRLESRSSSDTDTAWMRTVERRLADLERTSIDAAEAEEIAERVVKKYIKQLQVAVNTADGGQRVETVRFRSSSDSYGFNLAPGETLSSYTDPVTGQVVRCDVPTQVVRTASYSQPVPVVQTPFVEIRSQPLPVSQVRRVAMRPVVMRVSQPVVSSSGSVYQTQSAMAARSGLFGRQVTRSTARTCRIDANGNRVCN